jgi:hypothetical protein
MCGAQPAAATPFTPVSSYMSRLLLLQGLTHDGCILNGVRSEYYDGTDHWGAPPWPILSLLQFMHKENVS